MSEEAFLPEEELAKMRRAGDAICSAMGVGIDQWAEAEMGIILKTWAGRTKVADPKKLENSALIRAYRTARRVVYGISRKNKGATPQGTASINVGIRGEFGKTYYRTRKGGALHLQDVFGANFSRPRKHIYNDADWPAIEKLVSIFRTEMRVMVDRAKAAAGLGRQSIVQIADQLGIKLENVKGGGALSAQGIAKARAAIASDGKAYQNGFGRRSRSPTDAFVELINRYPKGAATGMDRTLAGVVMGRIKYAERNLEEGVFLSAARTAKAYPYLEVLKAA